jgi:hypothetical protein
VAQDIDRCAHQRHRKQERHRQIEQADRPQLPVLERLPHNHDKQQRQQRESDPLEASGTEGPQRAVISTCLRELLPLPIARQTPGKENTQAQREDLPEKGRILQIPPKLKQQGKHDLFVHFRSITAA